MGLLISGDGLYASLCVANVFKTKTDGFFALKRECDGV